MSEQLRMKAADRKALTDAAKQGADVIDGDELDDFLGECARWGGNQLVKVVLENIRIPKGKRRRRAWKQSMKDAGFKIKFPSSHQWCEVTDPEAAAPDVFGQTVQDVKTPATPGDPEADPPVEPTEAVLGDPRPAKWSELGNYQSRRVGGKVRHFVALSDGVEYFDDDTVDTITADSNVIGAIHIEDLPAADEVVLEPTPVFQNPPTFREGKKEQPASKKKASKIKKKKITKQ